MADSMAKTKTDTIDRFKKKVVVNELTGCWEWIAFRNHQEYGYFQLNNKSMRANRVSWMLFRGEIPGGMFVCHRCDNPPCVNPDHLFLGDVHENNADMVRKGRNSKGDRHWTRTIPARRAVGERQGLAVLKDPDIVEIRRRSKDGETITSIARRFNVSRKTIYLIRDGVTWRHVA